MISQQFIAIAIAVAMPTATENANTMSPDLVVAAGDAASSWHPGQAEVTLGSKIVAWIVWVAKRTPVVNLLFFVLTVPADLDNILEQVTDPTPAAHTRTHTHTHTHTIQAMRPCHHALATLRDVDCSCRTRHMFISFTCIWASAQRQCLQQSTCSHSQHTLRAGFIQANMVGLAAAILFSANLAVCGRFETLYWPFCAPIALV